MSKDALCFLSEALSPSNLRKVKKTYRNSPIRMNSTHFFQSFVCETFPFAAHCLCFSVRWRSAQFLWVSLRPSRPTFSRKPTKEWPKITVGSQIRYKWHLNLRVITRCVQNQSKTCYETSAGFVSYFRVLVVSLIFFWSYFGGKSEILLHVIFRKGVLNLLSLLVTWCTNSLTF